MASKAESTIEEIKEFNHDKLLDWIKNIVRDCSKLTNLRNSKRQTSMGMLEHFHGLQYADEHQSLYKVCKNILNNLDVRTYFSFNHSRVSKCKTILTKEK